jgi:hypothetical protein
LCQFWFLKMTRTTQPLHEATSSIPKATPATPGVVSPMPRFANSKKRKLTLQADRQKRKQTKATASRIEGSTTQITTASTPIAALQPSLPRRMQPPFRYRHHPVSFPSVFIRRRTLVICGVHTHHHRLHNSSHRLRRIHRRLCQSGANDMGVEVSLHQVTFELLLYWRQCIA